MAEPRAGRRLPFRQADVARALRAVQGAGLPFSRVEIDQAGKIVIVSQAPPEGESMDGAPGPSPALQAWRKRNADRRAQRAASRQEDPR